MNAHMKQLTVGRDTFVGLACGPSTSAPAAVSTWGSCCCAIERRKLLPSDLPGPRGERWLLRPDAEPAVTGPAAVAARSTYHPEHRDVGVHRLPAIRIRLHADSGPRRRHDRQGEGAARRTHPAG